MGQKIHSVGRRLYRDENGAVAVIIAISIVAMLGLMALAVDVGSLVYAERTLQATADVAALAGAQDISCPGCAAGTAITTAKNYSAVSGSYNVQPGLTVTTPSGYPTLTCLTYTDIDYNSSTGKCTGLDAANAIIVKQQAVVPLLFAPVLGFNPTITLSATSIASKAIGAFPPLNVMLVIDNTGSMNTTDPTNVTCGGITHATRLDCALSGSEIFLSELWPTLDNVGLIVFPGVNNSTSATDDASCSSSLKSSVQIAAYGPSIPVYQIAPASGLLHDYKTSNATSSLSISSKLVTATCQSGMTTTSPLTGSNVMTCGTCAGLNAKGGQGTYYAGAINAAQQVLTANSQPGVQNVIILLSDGGAGNGTTLGPPLTTLQATPAGQSHSDFTSSVPAAIIPGTSVADTQSRDTSAIPTGTTVVSTSGSTVTISNNVINLNSVTYTTSAATAAGSNTLHFASLPPGLVAGASVANTAAADSTAIPAGTRVSSISVANKTVTISNNVIDLNNITYKTNAATSNNTVLHLQSAVPGLVAGASVADATVGHTGAIPAGTTVTLISGTNVTISNKVTVNSGDSIAFGFVGQGDFIAFGFVGQGDAISFGSNNQCHEGIAAAQAAIAAGTWIYSIAYGATTNTSSCSDTETPPISSCATMQQIASDATKFYSDPMGQTPVCTSTDNPSATDIGTIFAAIGNSLRFTQTVSATPP